MIPQFVFIIACLLLTHATSADSNSHNPIEMQAVYAPWRDEYISSTDQQDYGVSFSCPFCAQYAACNDETYLIVARFDHFFVMLNTFPYTKGHLLIACNDHIRSLHDLSRQARAELMELITASYGILRKELGIEGANIGINLERVAGASVPGHLHAHIVPRKKTDANFMKIIGKTTIISWDLHKLFVELQKAFKTVEL